MKLRGLSFMKLRGLSFMKLGVTLVHTRSLRAKILISEKIPRSLSDSELSFTKLKWAKLHTKLKG